MRFSLYWIIALTTLNLTFSHTFASTAVVTAAEIVGQESASSPVLVQPEDGLLTTGATAPTNGVPTFVWQAVPDASKYRIQISSSAGFSDPFVDQSTYATSFTPLANFPDGQYYWRVQVFQNLAWGSFSETRTFIKDWSNNGTIRPTLLSPIEDSELKEFLATDFSWSAVPGAAAYLFEIGADPSFGTVIYSSTTLTTRHTPPTRLKNDQYYWRVTPLDNQKNSGRPSEVSKFILNWNSAPVLLEPAHLLEAPFTPQFSWSAVKSAHSYHLEISTQPDFGSANTYVTHIPQFSPEKALSNDQDYYWHVKAVDHSGNSTSWSETRLFRRRWDFRAQLLTPPNNSIMQSYPFFSWTPIPGAERYQVQVDESTSFANPLMDKEFYNATSTAIVKNTDLEIFIGQDYFWRVRGIDSEDNYTPWSNEYTFRFGSSTSPNLIYPPYYATPDVENTPVHSDATIAWPLFIWDTSHIRNPLTGLTSRPEYYEITVSEEPSFQTVNFQIATPGLAAAPTAASPFANLVDGQLYYWRVQAFLAGEPVGIASTWVTRVDRNSQQLPFTDTITPIYPADAFEAVDAPPVLGWLPVTGASNYLIEISTTPDFDNIVDSAEPQFVNYVPWQHRLDVQPFGQYWWRVRAQSAPGVALGEWSAARSFNISRDLVTGNQYDFTTPPYPNSLLNPAFVTTEPTTSAVYVYDPDQTRVYQKPMTESDFALGDLHVMLNRISLRADQYPKIPSDLTWILAFEVAPTPATLVTYGVYIDIDHKQNSGATTDPLGKPINVDSFRLPEYVIYIERQNNSLDGGDAKLFTWTGSAWNPGQTLNALGGDAWYASDTSAIQLMAPYTALGAGDIRFSGSLAITVFSSEPGSGTGIVDAVPPQANTGADAVFVTDMLMPLYPFDTPLSNPIIHYDLPPLRWRMPYFDSVDGYEIQIARDLEFTDIVETWSSHEANTVSLFGWIPATFRSTAAYHDNESYYWRVRIRHERYTITQSNFDYGPWSPAMRFKLDSRQVANPTLSTGNFVGTTPAFSWDRVEGAAGYTIQIDDDATFGKPVLSKNINDISYTPLESLADGSYFWRVALRRSDNVMGHWTPVLSFQKNSNSPIPVSPINDEVIHQQPTLHWAPVHVITGTNRVAAPQYQIQIDDDPNFGSPMTYKTAFDTYTLSKSQSLADGTWYWRVATIDAKTNIGTYSAIQRFYKEYVPPQLIAPEQGISVNTFDSFEWTPISGAARYEIQFATDAQFNQAIAFKTDNTRFSPTVEMNGQEYYWRVRMIDYDNNMGPYIEGRVSVESEETVKVFIPLINKN